MPRDVVSHEPADRYDLESFCFCVVERSGGEAAFLLPAEKAEKPRIGPVAAAVLDTGEMRGSGVLFAV